MEQSRPVDNEASLLISVMVEQPIIQVAVSSVEMFNVSKSKFVSCIASAENVAQISGQDSLCIAASKIVGSPLT